MYTADRLNIGSVRIPRRNLGIHTALDTSGVGIGRYDEILDYYYVGTSIKKMKN